MNVLQAIRGRSAVRDFKLEPVSGGHLYQLISAASWAPSDCWIGFAQGWLNTSKGDNLLNLPKGAFVVAPIIVGHPRTEIPPVARKAPFANWIGHRHRDGEFIEEPVLEGPGIYGAIIHP